AGEVALGAGDQGEVGVLDVAGEVLGLEDVEGGADVEAVEAGGGVEEEVQAGFGEVEGEQADVAGEVDAEALVGFGADLLDADLDGDLRELAVEAGDDLARGLQHGGGAGNDDGA